MNRSAQNLVPGRPEDDFEGDRQTLFGVGPGSDPPPPPSQPSSPEGQAVEAEGYFSRELFSLLEAYAKKRRDRIAQYEGPGKTQSYILLSVNKALEGDFLETAHRVAQLAYDEGKTFADLQKDSHIIQFNRASIFGDSDFLTLVFIELDALNERFSRALRKLLDTYTQERKTLLKEQESADIGRFTEIESILDSRFWKMVDALADLAYRNKKTIADLQHNQHIQEFQKANIGDMDFLTLVNFSLHDLKSSKEKKETPKAVAADVKQRVTMVKVGKTPSEPPPTSSPRPPMDSMTREKGGTAGAAE